MLTFKEFIAETIKKVKGGWQVQSKKKDKSGHPKNLGGPYPTKAEAKKRLHDVEAFKHMKR